MPLIIPRQNSAISRDWCLKHCERNQDTLPCAIGEFAKLNKLDSRMVKVWFNNGRQRGHDKESCTSSASSGGNDVVGII